jgi:beta-galactosidase/beta-glucuronidase
MVVEQRTEVVARTEYPRPRLVRETWQSLNGAWGFAFDPEEVGIESGFIKEERLDRTIQVPFAYQTRLSGIDDQRIVEVVWYAKNFVVPPDWSGKTILLHFGAVDHEVAVWLNGVEVGKHVGGYTPFSFDITHLMAVHDNRLTLRVVDRQNPAQPRGKQSSTGKPHGIDYWCTTGIWQSVWLEPVSQSYLADLVVTSEPETKTLNILPTIYGSRADVEIEIEILDGEVAIASKTVTDTLLTQPIGFTIHNPKLWSPDSPHLYNLRVRLTLQGSVIDEVHSYAGIRSVDVGQGKIWLNGSPIYLKMVLDQGYWPESGLTAPSDEALEADVLLVKQLGFNAVRKHQKVEDPRWLYWCDRHGLLVWGEMANARAWSFETQTRLETEWISVVERDRSHPCIIVWVPVNESMGYPELKSGDARQRNGIERLAHLTRRLDPTRPIVDNDGWEQTGSSDIVAIHDYSHSGADLAARYSDHLAGADFPTHIWSGSRITLLPGVQLGGRPILLTEVGGLLSLPSDSKNLDKLYQVYNSVRDSQDLLTKYRALMFGIGSLPFLSGFCYTQFTDVEQEINGLLLYDRTPKVAVDQIAEVHRTMLNPNN